MEREREGERGVHRDKIGEKRKGKKGKERAR
jgi:hypothetical protein